MSLTTTVSHPDPDQEVILPGDIVAVHHGRKGRQEGLVIGSHFDHLGTQIVEVRLDGDIYTQFYPSFTRVRRVVSYSRPSARRVRTVERRVLW